MDGKKGITSPRETYDPNPVFFLVIEKGVSFSFPFMVPSETDADKIEHLLELGLDWLGIGAKTASGYGTFEKENAGKRHISGKRK